MTATFEAIPGMGHSGAVFTSFLSLMVRGLLFLEEEEECRCPWWWWCRCAPESFGRNVDDTLPHMVGVPVSPVC